jgi:hypothetical protein
MRLLGRVRVADPFTGVSACAEPTSNDVSSSMANKTVAAIFYKEVVDAIARNPPHVGDLVVLKDLCGAVDASDKGETSRLTRELVQLDGTEDPLHGISYELFHALMARMLIEGWFEEFDLLLDWDQTLFSDKNSRTADKWEGIIGIVTTDPQSLGLAGQVDHEKEWQRALNGFEGVIRHFAKVKFPSPSGIGAPPDPPPTYETVLPRILHDAIEAFYRTLQMIFQQILELGLARLERDNNDVQGLRTLQKLRLTLGVLLDPDDPQKSKQLGERLRIILDKRIRVVEFRYGRDRAKQHRFLDAFPPFDSRSVIFNSLDREDKDEPYVRGDRIGNIQVTRTRLLPYLATMYGHPTDASKSPDPSHLRRRAFITSKHGGQLKFIDNDDLIVFLSNFFDDALSEFMRPGGAPADQFGAAVRAWKDTVELTTSVFSQLTAHSRLNLTEGPPNYLTHAFPRNLAGRMLHDCGVFAVRWAYTLLSVFERINRSHSSIAGTVRARWVRLPLHVGLMIESKFGVVVEHNESAFMWNADEVRLNQQAWEDGRPDYDNDSNLDDAALALKFLEDLAANGFSSDLDLPIRSISVLADGEAVTKQTIWNSYQKKVVPSQLFTSLVAASNTPQYQFDVRYLRNFELEREWFNEVVLGFWNGDCNNIWKKWKDKLSDPSINNNPAELKKNKEWYINDLNEALEIVDKSYGRYISPKKDELSQALRGDQKQLLLPDVRIVASERLRTVLPAVEKVNEHISEITPPTFKFTGSVPPFVPLFARPEEVLLEVP